ncbi:MAG: response regulator transcription factor [Flavihumibacter sp.]|nr:response regulator transcription factor [Flavihumibacter sp.]
MTQTIKPTRIVLVDDHILLRNSLSGLINSFEDFEVILEADNGQDFIEKLKTAADPDIILLDITMPKMNGYETAEWIRKELPLAKVLILSMMDADSAIIQMLKLGAKGYILKDSKPSIFKQALISVRDQGFYMNDLVTGKMVHFINNLNSLKKEEQVVNVHLTDRELCFLKLACSEDSYKEIAEKMFVSVRTVESYRDAIFEKIGVNTRIGLVLYSIKNGIHKF